MRLFALTALAILPLAAGLSAGARAPAPPRLPSVMALRMLLLAMPAWDASVATSSSAPMAPLQCTTTLAGCCCAAAACSLRSCARTCSCTSCTLR